MKDLDPAFRGSGQKEYPFQAFVYFVTQLHYDRFLAFVIFMLAESLTSLLVIG
jgi:hypothetical protein